MKVAKSRYLCGRKVKPKPLSIMTISITEQEAFLLRSYIASALTDRTRTFDYTLKSFESELTHEQITDLVKLCDLNHLDYCLLDKLDRAIRKNIDR